MADQRMIRLSKVKDELAKKYEHLATTRHSKPGRDKLTRRALDYRHQAKELARMAHER